MKVSVVVFPGSNCDNDIVKAFDALGNKVDKLWHNSNDAISSDVVVLPGGFSYGDYLRCGAMAAVSPIMQEVKKFAEKGGKVIGICNGFQILCESQLLPGALLINKNRSFLCKDVYLTSPHISSKTPFTVPIAHGEGRYHIDEKGLKNLQDQNNIAFYYSDAEGKVGDSCENGSMKNIAGIFGSTEGKSKNILGMMPHPERAFNKSIHHNDDGVRLIKSVMDVFYS